ncbi:MAG: hypothetical protein AAFQ60_07735, partial [Pseudomonadota bacterium]
MAALTNVAMIASLVDKKQSFGVSLWQGRFRRADSRFQHASDGLIRDLRRITIFVDVDGAQPVSAADDHETSISKPERHGPSAGERCQQSGHQNERGKPSRLAFLHSEYVACRLRHHNSIRVKIRRKCRFLGQAKSFKDFAPHASKECGCAQAHCSAQA